MTGSALFDFLIAIIGLIGVGVLIFYCIDFLSQDITFRKIARTAVGIVLLIAFLVAVKGVLFGSGGSFSFSPVNLIEFAIGLIVLLVVIFIIYWVIDWLAVPFAVPLKYIIGALALIALLVLAEKALFGGGLGLSNFRQRSETFQSRTVVAGVSAQATGYMHGLLAA